MEITHNNYESGETVPRYCLYKQTSDTLIAELPTGLREISQSLEKAPNRGFSLLRVLASTFTINKNLLRYHAKWALSRHWVISRSPVDSSTDCCARAHIIIITINNIPVLSSLIIRISSPSPFPPPTSGTVQQTCIDQFYKHMFYDMKYTLYISSLSLAFILSPGWASCPQKAVVYISRFKCCKINYDYCRVAVMGSLS